MIPIRMKTIVSAAICSAAWLYVFWPILFGGQMFWYGDLSLYFVPLLHFQRAELLTGHLPLWNPWILCGTPFFGNPQAWPLYPSSLLLWVFSAERTAGLTGALHCLWAMLGAGLFFRRRGLGQWGSGLGALSFGLGGALVSKCQFPNMVQAGSWLPWLLWAVEGIFPQQPPPGGGVIRGTRRTGDCAMLALCIGLAILSAHPQMTWMQALLCAGWVAFRRPGRRVLMRLALATMLGGLLAAGQLLPVIGAALDSVRPRLSLAEASRFYLPIYMLPTVFAAPNFYGNPFTLPPYIGRGNFWEPCGYAGLVPLALAGPALRGVRNISEMRFWLAVFVVCVWLALGKAGGLYTLAFRFLPGAKTFHDPARFLHLSSFALAALAATGLDRLKARDAVKIGLLALAAVDLALFVHTLNPVVDAGAFRAAEARLARTLSGAGRVWQPDAVGKKIWWRFVDYRALSGGSDPLEMLSTAVPNTPMLIGVRDAGGYEPVRRRDYERVTDRSAAGVTDILSWTSGAGAARRSVPRAARATLDGARLAIASEAADRVEFALPADRPGGALVLYDVAAPGWRAEIDGRDASIRRVSGVFREIAVPAGARRAVFRYEPVLVRAGLFLTLLGTGILTALRVPGTPVYSES